MSTLNVANITDGTTTVETSYVVNGSAKAWVNFNGTGTVAIRDSLNVASITDLGVSNYRVDFASALPDANYSAVVTGLGGPSDTRYFNLRELLSTSVRVGQAGDISIVCVSVHR